MIKQFGLATAAASPLKFLLLVALAIILFFYNPLSELAARQNLSTAAAGTTAYAALRVINSVMSVAKDADIEAGVAVASATVSPGQVLEPVTETLDRISSVLFGLIIVSTVIAMVILPVSKVAAVVLGIGAAASAISRIKSQERTTVSGRLARSTIAIGLMGAVLVPGVFAAASVAGDHITKGRWENAQQTFSRISAQVDDEAFKTETPSGISESPQDATDAPLADEAEESDGMFSSIGGAIADRVSSAGELVGTVKRQAMASLTTVAETVGFASDLLQASVELAAAYVVQAIVLPIVLLIALYIFFRQYRQA